MNQNVKRQAERELRARVHGAVLPRPEGPDGTDNYTQADVAGLAKAFTGWRLITRDDRRRHEPGLRQDHVHAEPLRADRQDVPRPARSPTVTHDRTANAAGFGAGAINQAVDIVLAHAQPRAVPDPQAVGRVHRQPDPAGARSTAWSRLHGRAASSSSRVIRGDPHAPADLRVDRRAEPDQAADRLLVGVLRQLDAPLKGNTCRAAMIDMQQQHLPPAERRGLGGRHVVAEHEHGAGPLRPGRHRRST